MRNRNFRSILFESVLALGLGGLCVSDAMAQNNPFRDKPLVAAPADAPNIFPEPTVDPTVAARSDALAAAEDWKGLRAAVFSFDDPAAVGMSTNWLKLKTDQGGSFIFPFLYARNLWLIGEGFRQVGIEPAKAKSLRDDAVLMSLYTVALVHMDGMACADPTAPNHWLTNLAQSDIGGALRYWSGAPPEFKDQTVRVAVGLEAITARRRKAEDPMVCSGGMAEMDAGMRAGTIGDGKAVPGRLDEVREVKPPPGWKPSFLPASVYVGKQDKERGAALYDYLYPAEKSPDAETLAAAARLSEGPPAPAGTADEPAVKLALAALPPMPDPESTNIVLRYTLVAKAWWLETRCHMGEPAKADGLKAGVAVYTQAMRVVLKKVFGISESRAEEYVEKIQMYRLEELSAAKFYGCGPDAKTAFAPGLAEVQRVSLKP